MAAGLFYGGFPLDLMAPVVALKVDPARRETSWVTLTARAAGSGGAGGVGAGVEPEIEVLGLLFAASSEKVHPLTYAAVQCELGLESPLEVAPYQLKRAFCGSRILVWTNDNSPSDLPGVRFAFGSQPFSGRWLDTCFIVAYPVLPSEQAAPVAIPGTSFATRPGDDLLAIANDTRAVLEPALRSGKLRMQWLSAAEAAAAPASQFRMERVITSVVGDGAGRSVEMRNQVLPFQCAVCDAPCRMTCSRCRSVAYCGVEHQRAAWRAHKPVCRKNF